MPLLEVLATTAGLSGSYLVYLSWKRHSTPLAVWGWALLLGSIPIWIFAQGPEFGTIYALCLPAFFVWLGIFQEQKWQQSTNPVFKTTTQWRWNNAKVWANTGHVLFVLPVLMLASSSITISMVFLLPMSDANKMATGVIALPIVWGVMAFWYQISANKKAPLLFSVIGTALSCYHLFG